MKPAPVIDLEDEEQVMLARAAASLDAELTFVPLGDVALRVVQKIKKRTARDDKST